MSWNNSLLKVASPVGFDAVHEMHCLLFACLFVFVVVCVVVVVGGGGVVCCLFCCCWWW